MNDDPKIIKENKRDSWLKTFAAFSALNFLYSNIQNEKSLIAHFFIIWMLVIALLIAIGYDVEISPSKVAEKSYNLWRKK